jgi:hypothetical protein
MYCRVLSDFPFLLFASYDQVSVTYVNVGEMQASVGAEKNCFTVLFKLKVMQYAEENSSSSRKKTERLTKGLEWVEVDVHYLLCSMENIQNYIFFMFCNLMFFRPCIIV